MRDGHTRIEELTTRDLLRRFREENDHRAFDVLYSRHRPVLLRIIRLRMGDVVRSRMEEEDILHDVYVKALEKLESFTDRGSQSLRKWLNTILVNRIKDIKKRKALRSERVTSFERTARERKEEALTPSAEASRHEELDRIVEIVRTLPEPDREIFTLRYFQELGYEEIARMLDMPVSTVCDRYLKTNAAIVRRLRRSSRESGCLSD